MLLLRILAFLCAMAYPMVAKGEGTSIADHGSTCDGVLLPEYRNSAPMNVWYHNGVRCNAPKIVRFMGKGQVTIFGIDPVYENVQFVVGPLATVVFVGRTILFERGEGSTEPIFIVEGDGVLSFDMGGSRDIKKKGRVVDKSALVKKSPRGFFVLTNKAQVYATDTFLSVQRSRPPHGTEAGDLVHDSTTHAELLDVSATTATSSSPREDMATTAANEPDSTSTVTVRTTTLDVSVMAKEAIAYSSTNKLGPRDAPLKVGDYLSSACNISTDGDDGVLVEGVCSAVPAFVSRAGSGGVCVWPTDEGTLRITRGHEPDASQEPLVEVGGTSGGGRAYPKGWFGGGGNAESLTTGSAEKIATETSVRRGQLEVAKVNDVCFWGVCVKRKEVLYRSERPKGWWRVFVAPFNKRGREIRDAECVVSPDEHVAMQTTSGEVLTVLWGPALD